MPLPQTSRPAEVAPAAAAKPQPYTYPAPVSGHFKEINTGDFDLVDGIAWGPNRAGETVVYVTDKPIASPVLGERCPMSEARALSILRTAGWNEIALDGKGKSKYFGSGHPFGGTSRSEDVGSHEWKFARREAAGGRPEVPAGQIAGKLTHQYYGAFDFNLPIHHPEVKELGENERMDGGLSRPDLPRVDAAAVAAAFRAIRTAALAKDLTAWLAAQGFNAEQIAAIRGLPGIDADLERLSLRFLTPDTADAPEARAGTGVIRAEGANTQGAKFANYYYLVPCGDRTLLAAIAENPQ